MSRFWVGEGVGEGVGVGVEEGVEEGVGDSPDPHTRLHVRLLVVLFALIPCALTGDQISLQAVTGKTGDALLVHGLVPTLVTATSRMQY